MGIVKASEPVGEGFYVKCPGCGGIFHETTATFEASRAANGAMFVLLPMYGASGANWQSFPYQEEVMFEALICPGCGASYTQGGSFVNIVPKAEIDNVETPAEDLSLHLEYKEMADQGMFPAATPEQLDNAK